MHSGWIMAGVVFAVGGIALAAAVRTRWLQSDTLRKCLLLSVLAHVAIAIVAASIGGFSPASWGRSDAGRMTIVTVVSESPDGETAAVEDVAGDVGGGPAETPAAAPAEIAEAERPPELLSAPNEPLDAEPASADPSATTLAADTVPPEPMPRDGPYALRQTGRRAAAAMAHGGSEETERAVARGLAWLSRSQSGDGRWDAARHGAGIERSVQGHHRHGAGARSDHGVTGLATLAFLGAGNTHRDGRHAAEVSRAIDFLVSRQRPDGSLSGEAEFFASLYCHGMATIAVAEAAAMTGDERLRAATARAIGYTLSMQNPTTGGWRYAAGDRGDTSQLGWQVMALSAARHAGVSGVDGSLTAAGRFLVGVSSGRSGGLAAYRPGERPSAAMTGEALFCRFLLGLDATNPAVTEAVAFLETAPPDSEPFNAYACYYGTLAMFHAGGESWERWNTRMQRAVLPVQRSGGEFDGSWDPDTVWGGHGGRVYATALSVLCLEVYYRYLPLHQGRNARVASIMPGS